MSKIDKLSILGVRSFDNVRSETIQFNTPLTLIVGLNGSGKTTIIECLKYVTTGDLPPNSKVGGAFIHDSKLCGEKEVLAQVKVSFRSTEGTRMVCTRNMQLTVKKATRSMKTLEGNLLMIRDGERMTMSSRVAEMDTMMPQYLGVSKAILDSVIFCHQEESLWPLSEPSKLKVRFDEIFEALKYTKAIENIKVLQKRKRDELNIFKKDEEHTKVMKNKGADKNKQILKLDQDIASLREQSAQKSTLIKEAAKNAENAWELSKKANFIVSDLNGKRMRRDTKEESVQNLRRNLSEMSDSDEDLQRMLDQYEERVQAYEDDLESKKGRYGELRNETKSVGDQVSAKERECGSYEAQKESYNRQVQQRERLVKETARSHNIRGFDLEIDDAQVKAFMERISKMARDQNAAFERARRETQEELQSAQKVLNQINQQRSALTQRKENARQTISTNDKKISSLQRDLNNINIDEGGKAAMESNLAETEAKLDSAKSNEGSANWSSAIETAEADMRKLDERKEKLDAELVEGTRQAGDSARLDFVRKELKAKQESLETMKGAHGEKISAVLGHDWTPANVESGYQRIVNQHSSHVAEAERQRDGTSRELEQLNFKLNTCQTDLQAKQKILKDADAAIRKALECEPSEYPEAVKKLEAGRDFAKADVDSFTQVVKYFDACIKDAKEHKACRTCCRGFANDKELDRMLKTIQKEKKKFESGDEVKEELAELDEELQKAKAVSSQFDAWERLTHKEIPALQRDSEQFSAKREQFIAQLEEQDATVSERQAAKRDVEAMSKTVQTIAKYSADITSFEGQAKELQAKQKAAGLSRGLEIVQDEIKKVNDEARALKSRLSKATGDRDRCRANINTLELEKRDIKSKLTTADYQLKEKRSLEGQIEEYKGLNNEQRDAIKSIDQELSGLGPQLNQAQVKYDDIARRGEEKDRELQAEASKLNNSLNQLKSADQEIRAYLDKGGPEQLKSAKRQIEHLKESVTRLEEEQGRIVREVKSLEDQLRNHSETKRSIQDNQQFRRDQRALRTLQDEIAELETHNAEEDFATHEREGSRWQMERNKLSAEQATIIGSMRSKDDMLQESMQEYTTEYEGAARKYQEAHINYETTKACVEDLGRYAGALDKAIMKYHSIKMEEINRIVEELWRKTYQGTDVDTVMIKSESENAASKKSYNYRVVMVKQDAEMDMRGRCSAGQKVLASIIIRLALAECFGVNCGLIALDEPTTNLDKDNIGALARALNEIIKVRKSQKNFQLIVITHDEDFLREMNCSEYADTYYRVSRNEKQKSQIERQSIAEVL
ncbi:DNA repair protein rad50 [Vermiconidia calcicola]|uniref:DNA repair protein rad50 n=1 Tax=Vermiconidia calcicola TaxID=1690605 RepID=A0ACC3NC08_9PEZI|nr:DNA repair protein rad50 [Vermiconidia calcicola]